MTFLEQIQNQKSKLETTETVVRKLDFFVEDKTKDDIPMEIIPGIYLGSYQAAENEKELKKLGITHILNFFFDPLGYDWAIEKQCKCLDIEIFPIDKFFVESHQFIDQALENGKVLVNCWQGASRSATIVISYLMKTQKKNFEETYRFVKNKRKAVQPNRGFQKILQNYEKELFADEEKEKEN
ncbi:dual specificity protein phosphatase [Anaeramoeba flamelloides]|uniref:protein-tyrosine-phosphatase n=1 Tax=Anaeramoeba flamelloides TaxID=1746091 RepID=A0AAV7ZIN0_9EUKA|nr:dual specificity protein phosphatase [Anaeramoeba flamelloides]KAJ6241363.1 dual specificity protein phosphatase [Anaeramoeba flamelloides]